MDSRRPVSNVSFHQERHCNATEIGRNQGPLPAQKQSLNEEEGPISYPSFGRVSQCDLVVALLYFVYLVDAKSILFGEGGIVIFANCANLDFDGCTAAK